MIKLLTRQVDNSTDWRRKVCPDAPAGTNWAMLATPLPSATGVPNTFGLAKSMNSPGQPGIAVEPATVPYPICTVAPGVAPVTVRVFSTPAVPGVGAANTKSAAGDPRSQVPSPPKAAPFTNSKGSTDPWPACSLRYPQGDPCGNPAANTADVMALTPAASVAGLTPALAWI